LLSISILWILRDNKSQSALFAVKKDQRDMNRLFQYVILILLCSCSTQKFKKELPARSTYKYELDLDNYKEDKISVKLSLYNIDDISASFCFPKIVPGIYGHMNFGQFINSVTVTDKKNNTSTPKRLDVNCWKIENINQIQHIEYEVDDSWEVFNFEMEEGFYKSAATSFHEDVFLINTNCLFGYFDEYDKTPIELIVKKPEDMYGATSLQKEESVKDFDVFRAKDYHELVDNPIMYSSPDTSLIRLPNIDVEVITLLLYIII